MRLWKRGLVTVALVAASLGPMREAIGAQPSLHLEGRGGIGPASSPCSATACPGILGATLRGVPFAAAQLNLPISVRIAANGFTGCQPVTGRGQLVNAGQQYVVTFVGDF